MTPPATQEGIQSERALALCAAKRIDPGIAESVGVFDWNGRLHFPIGADADGTAQHRARPLDDGPVKVVQPKGVPLTPWWPKGRPDAGSTVTAALVCEGETDALSALTAFEKAPAALRSGPLAGVEVVALPGASTPADRLAAEMVAAGIGRAYLAFDADGAGRKAKARHVEALTAVAIEPVVVELRDGSDLSDNLTAADDPSEWLAGTLADAIAASEASVDSHSEAPVGSPVPAGEKLRKLDVARMIREEPPPVPWVVEGLVARGMLTVVNGREGEGKSLLAMALSAGVSGDQDEGGFVCHAGSAVIIDAENGEHEIHRRTRTLGLPATGVDVFEAQGFDLRGDLDELDAILAEYKPDLLVLDSFRSLWRGEENDSREVSAVLDPLRNLIRAHNAGTLLLHHSGKMNGAYRGSSAIGASAEMGFKLARMDDDDDPRRCYVETWKCRPAERPPRRWLRLAVERGQVYIDAADAPDGGEVTTQPHAPVREELAPRILAILTTEPQTRADIARSVGRGPKDRSVGRVLQELEAGGEARKSDTGWLKVAGSTPSIGEGHPATEAATPQAKALNGGGKLHSVEPLLATPAEESEAERIAAKFGAGVA